MNARIGEDDKPAGFISGADPDGGEWIMPYWLPGPAGGGRRDAAVGGPKESGPDEVRPGCESGPDESRPGCEVGTRRATKE